MFVSALGTTRALSKHQASGRPGSGVSKPRQLLVLRGGSIPRFAGLFFSEKRRTSYDCGTVLKNTRRDLPRLLLYFTMNE